jgi:hypothetical protein
MHENSPRTHVFRWHNESHGHLGGAEAVDQTFLKLTISTAIAAMEGRRNPSRQALLKWQEDIEFIESLTSKIDSNAR